MSEWGSLLLLCSSHILIFKNIAKKTFCRWKGHHEKNSEHFSECQSVLLLCRHHILIFFDIMKNTIPLEASCWAEFKPLFRMSKFIIFVQLPYINFIKYNEKSFTVASVMTSRIYFIFQNDEVYYLYASAIHSISKISHKIHYRWKHPDEQNPKHISECRSALFLCSCHIYIFLDIRKNALPLEALWWAKFRPPIRMSKFIIFIQSTYINFLEYSKKCRTVRNFMMSRIQITFQNIEVFYFYAAATY